jgi:hypothetical protein
MQQGTGTLWRIRRTEGPHGEEPPKPAVVPLYALQGLGIVAVVLGAVGAVAMLVRRGKKSA